MKSGQFVKGKIDGIQKHFKSPELNKILPKEKLAELEDYIDVGEYPRFFKAEKVLAKTVVTAADNSDGRRGGIINHTVLYQFEQSVTLDTVKYIFPLDDFITEILAGKRSFKMPPIPILPDSDSGLIELPPPIEWEAQP
jgi:hypothetical protein